MGDIRHLRTKLVGVTFPNADGSSRQALIARCRAGERLTLRHEPDNTVDDHAVAVYNAAGEQLGHLRSKLAREVVEVARGGVSWAAYVSEVTGGYGFKRSMGCNLVLVRAEAGVDGAAVDRYARALLATESTEVRVAPATATVEYERADEKRLKWPLTEYLKPPARSARRKLVQSERQPEEPHEARNQLRRIIIMAVVIAGGLVGLLILLTGCVSLTPEAERVRVVRNPNDVLACAKLGEQLESVSGWGGVFLGGAGLENNKATLRNRTAKLGGDTLLILQERAIYTPQTYGEAYRCAGTTPAKPIGGAPTWCLGAKDVWDGSRCHTRNQ